VTSAHAVILLLENPEAFGLSGDIKVDNLVLAGSPLAKDSKLYKKLLGLQEAGKIGNIFYEDYQSKGLMESIMTKLRFRPVRAHSVLF